MGRLKARRFDTKGYRDFILQNGSLLVLAALLLLGMVCGALLVKGEFLTVLRLDEMVKGFTSARQNQGFFVTCLASFLGILPFMALSIFLGLSSVGAPFIVLLPFVRGLGLGMISGFLYANMGLSGVAFAALILTPVNFLSSLAVILSCRQSLKLSVSLFGVVRPESPYLDLWPICREFLYRQGRYAMLLLASVLLDGILSTAFMRFFTFQ